MITLLKCLFLGVMRRKRAGGEGFQPLNTEEDYEDKL